MGMSIDHATADTQLAAYLLDALDADETLAVEHHLTTCAICQATLADLRPAVDALAATTATTPPAGLAQRTMDAALAARPPATHPFAPAEVHLIEATRVVALLSRLSPDDWAAPVGPAFPDWTVQDLAAHLASSEALLALELGVDPFTPDTEPQAEARALQAVARHRRLSPAETLAELRTTYELVQQTLRAIGDEVDARIISWFGLDLTLGYALTQRGFEIWTHADDIRAALGLDAVPPPAGSVRTMSSAALDTVPFMLSAVGVDAEGRRARVTLSGPGGGTYDVALGLAEAGTPLPEGHAPDVVVRLDSIDFCKAVAERISPPDLVFEAEGDLALADDLVRSLSALAVL